jgi:hypothetical protein
MSKVPRNPNMPMEDRRFLDDLSRDRDTLTSGLADVVSDVEDLLEAKPLFLVSLSADASNVTGDNTAYVVAFDTEIKDATNSFATSTFTAPSTGTYQFSGMIRMGGLAAGHTVSAYLNTSNRAYVVGIYDDAASASGQLGFSWATLADMDAADTATFVLQVSGGAKVVDVLGGASVGTYFSGFLVQ